MKTIVLKSLLSAVLAFCTLCSISQTVISTESFPNAFNANGIAGFDGTFTGNQGSWTTLSSTNFSIEIDADQFVSSPRALRFYVNNSSASTVIGDNAVTSPVVNLNSGSCQPSSASLAFKLYTATVINGNDNYTFGLQYFNGTIWSTAWSRTANQLFNTYGQNTWNTISVNLPLTYLISNFKYRFFAVKNATSASANTTELWVDDVQLSIVTTGPAFPDFSDPTPTEIVDAGGIGGGFEVGDVYKFDNVVSVPENIYAEVKIEAISNAKIIMLDNNEEGLAQRFQPRIAPSLTTLTNDIEGYVQFAITFKKVSNNAAVNISNLRYRHFDVDGTQVTSGGNRYTFRETGWVTGQSSLLANSPTDLTSASGGSDVYGAWTKILGELEEHDGVTNDPDVMFTTSYPSTSTIRFRLGYIFDETAGNVSFNPGTTGREYGTEFGCFSVQETVTLPLTLLNFNGSYNGNHAVLNWTTANEVAVDHFEVERKAEGANDYSKIGSLSAKGTTGATASYLLNDDLSNANGNVFYYRLKSIDKDGSFTYSKTILLKKDQRLVNELAVVPNPVVNNNASIRISSTSKTVADLRIMDFAGRLIKVQKLTLFEGINVIPVSDLPQLTAGVYTITLKKDNEVFNTKFIVGR